MGDNCLVRSIDALCGKNQVVVGIHRIRVFNVITKIVFTDKVPSAHIIFVHGIVCATIGNVRAGFSGRTGVVVIFCNFFLFNTIPIPIPRSVVGFVFQFADPLLVIFCIIRNQNWTHQ